MNGKNPDISVSPDISPIPDLSAILECAAVLDKLASQIGPEDATNAPRPALSFIIATYNVAPYIEAALQSALQQTIKNIEVIVVDDASTDGTPERVGKIASTDPRVTLIRQSKNSGPSKSRNLAIEHARGEWIAILDGDDTISPERSEVLLDLARATGADIVADNYERYIDGKPSGKTMIHRGELPYSSMIDIAAFIRSNIMFKKQAFALGAIKPVFRASFLRENKIRYDNDIWIGEDYHYCLDCLMATAKFMVTSQVHYHYRIRNTSLSWRFKKHHYEKLVSSHKALQLERRYKGNGAITKSATDYLHHLERAVGYIKLVDALKQKHWRKALSLPISQPKIFGLVMHLGPEIILKRLKPLFRRITTSQ